MFGKKKNQEGKIKYNQIFLAGGDMKHLATFDLNIPEYCDN